MTGSYVHTVAAMGTVVTFQVVGNISSEDAVADVRRKVQKLTEKFPLYSWKLEKAPAVG